MNRPIFTNFGWIKVTFLGWLAGIALILMLSVFFDSIGVENLQFYTGVGMGAGVGFTQWRYLKKLGTIDSKWFWFSVVGIGIPFVIVDILRGVDLVETGTYTLLWTLGISSFFVGLLQYKLLSGLSPQAYLWMFGAFISWTMGAATVFSLDYSHYISNHNMILFSINLFLILAGGIVLGILSGIFMKLILGPSKTLSA